MKDFKLGKSDSLKKSSVLFSLLLTFAVVVGFQNCGGGFDIASREPTGVNSFEVSDPHCNGNVNYDACVYSKLPSDQENFDYQGIKTSVGLIIPELKADTQFNLITSNYIVLSTKNLQQSKLLPQVDAIKAQLRMPAAYPDKQLVEKVQVLYWGEKVSNFVRENKGPALKKISIVVDGEQTGWAPYNGIITLGRNSQGTPIALDGGAVVHLLGESLFSRANQNKDFDFIQDDGHHTSCKYANEQMIDKECCTDMNGCSKSITAGMADYLVTQIFSEQSPSVGGLASLNPEGAQICGLTRNAALNRDLKIDQAFEACKELGQPGNIYAMGVLFGAIWNEVTANAVSSGLSKQQAHQLFVSLLSKIEPNETFQSLLSKIQILDPKLGELFLAEYNRRGISTM